MKITKRHKRDAKQLFRACLAEGLLDEERVRRLIARLIETRPRGYLGILGHLQRLVKLDFDRRTALVESATPVAPELQARLQAGLSRQYGPGLLFSFTQNPALISGLRIRVGSDVYDGTVQARLAALAESF